MTIQKVLKGPSLSSQKRGRKAMASLGRRVHYQASEVDRESVQMVDSEGQDLSVEQALERMGGPKHAYTEVVSDASVLETKALCERHQDMEPEEVMRAHFAEQARILEEKYYEGEKRILVAVHGEPDGSYHAHLLLPSDRTDLRNLDGQHGEARRAWDAAWRKDRKLTAIRDPLKREEARAEQSEIRARIKKIREEKKALDHELREARKGQDAERIHQANRAYAEQAGGLEERRHALEMERIDKFFVARKMTDSLEHKVEQAAELDRHVAAERQAQAAKFGLQRADVVRQNRAEREDFKHLNAAQRLKIREAGLERELTVVRDAQAWRLSGMRPGTPEHEAQVERHQKEIEGILLRHEAAKLRDQERDLAQASGQRTGWSDRLREAVGAGPRRHAKTLIRWSPTYPLRKKMMEQRHDLEHRSLIASAAGRGREPGQDALARLEKRQVTERKALAMEPAQMGADRMKSAAISKGKAVARGVAKLPGKALQKIQEAQKKLHKGRQREPDMQGAEVLKGATEQVGQTALVGAVKVATTAAVEAGKAALHQAQHAAEVVKVTAQAIAVGVVNPLAGVKEAGKGYAEVGAKSVKTAGQDLVSGTKNTSRDAATAAKDTAQQGLGSLVSGGLSAAPQEVQALARTMKEAVAASARATRQLVQGVITLNPLQAIGGTATEVAKGGLAVGKEATKMVAAKLPMPVEKTLDLAAKIPVLGLAVNVVKLSAKVGLGGVTKDPGLGR